MAKRKTNKWLVHVKSVAKKNKGKKFKEILKIAKKSYTPTIGPKTDRKRFHQK